MAQGTLAGGYTKVIAIAAVAVSAALLVSIFVVVPFFTLVGSANNDASGGLRIVTIAQPYADEPVFRNVKASDSGMQASSMQWVVDPFGRSMRTFHENRINSSSSEDAKRAWIGSIDAQEKYVLVRLPEWLGGSKNDLSSYRVFSAFDIMSQCNIRYWDTRMLIEDPCHGNGYRPWDGLVVQGIASFGASGSNAGLFSSSILALPQMRLGVDSEGYIVAYRLDNSLNGDGVVGEGRRFAPEQLEQSNKKMIEVVSEYAAFELPLPTMVSGGHHLVWLAPETMGIDLFPGQSFEGYEGTFSAVYQPRPLQEGYSSYRITIFLDEKLVVDDASQAKATFDKLFGTTASPECEQGCRYIVKSNDNAIARADTEGEENRTLYAAALAWGKSDGRDIMVAIEGINSSAEELLSIAESLGIAAY